ncbi:MAG: LacI family DNA-binding transcriptional regulator [Acidimicrobiia bacterium]|nr:LacI family DNA-binding transcriptional regulator [Acidimicrobiia bacterium]
MAHTTMEDVARRAGVSRSLVSLVMRASPHVSDERRARVLDAAAALGYSPNAMARGLASRRSGVVAVLINDLHNPFFAETFDGLAAEAESRGFSLLLGAGRPTRGAEQAALASFLEYRPDGIVLLSPRLPSAAIGVAARRAPVVVVGRHVRAAGVDSVMTDEREGARLVVDHLAGLGHRRIVHVDGGRGAGAGPRREGYRRAMSRAGLDRFAAVVPGDFTEQAGADAVGALMAMRRLPTSVFAANDLVAVGAIDALERAGHDVPGRVSVVGYDNTFFTRLGHISLTTVDQPREAMGRRAFELLAERMDRRDAAPHLVLTEPRLVQRATTTPPSRR